MPELLPENQHPPNQLSLEYLRQLNFHAAPHELYSLQLAWWGLDRQVQKVETRVKQEVYNLLQQHPKQANREMFEWEGALRPSLQEPTVPVPSQAARELLEGGGQVYATSYARSVGYISACSVGIWLSVNSPSISKASPLTSSQHLSQTNWLCTRFRHEPILDSD